MQKLNDLSRSLAPLEPDGKLIAVIEMSQSSWLVAGIVPGVERQPLKKLAADEIALLKLLHRWREEAEKAGRRGVSYTQTPCDRAAPSSNRLRPRCRRTRQDASHNQWEHWYRCARSCNQHWPSE